MILAGTGHRPDKLGGYGKDVEDKLLSLALGALEHYQPSEVISGFALGWDLSLAEAAYRCKIPLIAAIPCKNQSEKWQKEAIDKYRLLLAVSAEVKILSENYHPGVMQARNIWMVDRCDKVLALWNGAESGGTYNCIKYAQKKEKPIVSLWEIYKAL